jgi:hypothetical protein
MSTLSRRAPSVRPVSGSCRWLRPLVLDYHPGLLLITSHTTRGPVQSTYEVTAHAEDGLVVGYRLAKVGGDGAVHDVDTVSRPGDWSCDCRDYESRADAREAAGLERGCKHVRALKSALPKCPILV